MDYQPVPLKIQTFHDRMAIDAAYKAKLLLKYHWDYWTGWTGTPGSGKSTIAMWSCWYHSRAALGDNWFTHIEDRISYDAETFLLQIDASKPGTSLLLDEAAEAWYYKKWYDDVNIALEMASVQVRDKNLDIHLATPALGFIGPPARSRLRAWGDVTAPGFRRGHCEVWWPTPNKFKTGAAAIWWEPAYDFEFPELPDRIYNQIYLPVKRREARERLLRYIESVQDAGPKRSFREMVDECIHKLTEMDKATLDGLRNSRGTLDFGALQYQFPVTPDIAREAIRQFEPPKKKKTKH